MKFLRRKFQYGVAMRRRQGEYQIGRGRGPSSQSAGCEVRRITPQLLEDVRRISMNGVPHNRPGSGACGRDSRNLGFVRIRERETLGCWRPTDVTGADK